MSTHTPEITMGVRPKLQVSSQRPTTNEGDDYSVLNRVIQAEGLLSRRPGYYSFKLVTTLALVTAAVAGALVFENPALLLLNALFLGFACGQVEILGHDFGHSRVFRGKRTVLLSMLLMGNGILGLSYSWWAKKHNQHHLTPNDITQDGDVNFPTLVFGPQQIASKARWLRPIIAYQAFTFLLLLPLQPVNMRIGSIKHLRAGASSYPRAEAIGMALNVVAYGTLLWQLGGGWPIALGFVLIHQATLGLYNGSIFAPNHKGMPLMNGSQEMGFLQKQVTTARNVRGNPILDFWFGGLNYQIEHHLFSGMPRPNLKKARPIVKAFCEAQGIRYHETGLARSYVEIFQHLHRVSAPLRRRGAPSIS